MARDGFDEIYDFGEEWKGTENFNVTPVGNYEFSANVTYDSPTRGVESEGCTVRITRNGIQDGNLDIYARGVLQNETHHLAFSVRWQNYKFDKRNGAFIIEGNSPKMGGTYKVTVSPNGDKPSFTS